MRVLIVGLQGVEPNLLLDDDRLSHVQELLDHGISGVIHSDSALDPEGVWSTLVAGRSLDASTDQRGSLPRSLIWDEIGTEGEPVAPILVNLPFDRWFPTETPIGVESNRRISSADLGSGEAPWTPVEQTRERFRLLRRLIAERPWTVAMLLEASSPQGRGTAVDEDRPIALDEELGRTLNQVIAQGPDLCVLLLAWRGSPPGNQRDGVGLDPAGAFVLTSSKGLPSGVIEGARLVDLAPTILTLAGRAIPPEMQGRPLQRERISLDPSEEESAVRERLQGLGYLS